MKPQKIIQSGLSILMVVFLKLSPLYSREIVTENMGQSFINYLLTDAEGKPKGKPHPDFNPMELKKRTQNDLKPDHAGNERKHTDEEKHNNHVYSYDWIKSKKKVLANILRFFTRVFIAVCYIAVLLCGYMSMLH